MKERTITDYSQPPNTAAFGTHKKRWYWKNGSIGSHIFTLNETWKWAVVLGGGGG